MSALIRLLPSAAELLLWLQNLAIWLLARTLNLPAPLLQAASVFMFLKVQAFENSVGPSLCPLRLARRLIAYWRDEG
jgi:hypothetical protein